MKAAIMSARAPTVFISAATIDLRGWREIVARAFRAAQFRVLVQEDSLGAPTGNVRQLLSDAILQSDCVIHLAGLGYGSHATAPFPDSPDFRCSWTQFEYYHAHEHDIPVIAYPCAPEVCAFERDEDGTASEREEKAALQKAHRDRVSSGWFHGTPLESRGRTVNGPEIRCETDLTIRIAEAVGTLSRQQGTPAAVAPALEQAREKLLTLRSLFTLHAPKDGFTGREKELTDLRDLAAASEEKALITGLKGMGGIGKTQLALVLAQEWKSRYPDAHLLLDGRGTQADPPSGADLLAEVIQVFHPEAKLPDDLSALRGIYHDLLHERKVLLLLDNAADADQATALLPPPGSALLVTSRRSFLLDGRAAYSVGRMKEAEARELLLSAYPALTGDETAELIRLCAGLPLALRLAAAHLKLDAADRGGVADVAGYLQALASGPLATLDQEAEDAGEITIAETLRLSLAQLSEAERSAWTRLGIFTASFDAAAALAVAGADPAMLTTFRRRSLLEPEGPDRDALHDLAAVHARALLDEEPTASTRLAHAQHYAAVGNQADNLYLQGDPVVGLVLFDQERTHLEAAFDWLRSGDTAAATPSSQPDRDRLLFDLVNAVVYTGSLRFHPRQHITWREAQRDAARRLGDRMQEGNALGNLGNAHYSLGDASHAIDYHEQALVVSREIGDRRAEGQVLGNLGVAHAALGDARRAIDFYEQQLAIAREIGDRRGEGAALGNLGLAHAALGDARRAIDYHEQDLVIAREIGDRSGEGAALGNLGIAHKNLGDARRAIGFYEQQLVIAREIGDRKSEGSALSNLGNARADLDDARRAIDYHEQHLVIARETDDRRGEGNALGNLGNAHYSLGDAENRAEAIRRAESALRIYEATENQNATKVRAALAQWRQEEA